jgi:hypothetical protein
MGKRSRRRIAALVPLTLEDLTTADELQVATWHTDMRGFAEKKKENNK